MNLEGIINKFKDYYTRAIESNYYYSDWSFGDLWNKFLSESNYYNKLSYEDKKIIKSIDIYEYL